MWPWGQVQGGCLGLLIAVLVVSLMRSLRVQEVNACGEEKKEEEDKGIDILLGLEVHWVLYTKSF